MQPQQSRAGRHLVPRPRERKVRSSARIAQRRAAHQHDDSSVQRLEPDREWTPATPADRRSRRGRPNPTSLPSANRPRPGSPDARPTIRRSPSPRSAAGRPARVPAPARSWCANHPGAPTRPPLGRPASRRTPRFPRPRHTPAGPACPQGRRRGDRGSSPAPGRRMFAPRRGAAAAASPGGRYLREPGTPRAAPRPRSPPPIAYPQSTAAPTTGPASAVDKAPAETV